MKKTMALIVLQAVLVCVCLLQAMLETVYYVHMLQLNSYRPERYRKWMLEHDKRTLPTHRLLFSGLPLAVMMMFGFEGTLGVVVTAIAACLCFVGAMLDRPKTAKKPLVATPRVKRLFATLAAINIVLLALVWVMPWVTALLQPLLFGKLTVGALTTARILPAI